MRKTAFHVCLAFWLAMSLAFWAFGFAFAGDLFLPPLNPFTLSVLYAPWLILLAVDIRAWRLRREKIVT